jgi:hypothetical protein
VLLVGDVVELPGERPVVVLDRAAEAAAARLELGLDGPAGTAESDQAAGAVAA